MTNNFIFGGMIIIYLLLIIIAIKKDFQKLNGSNFKKDLENYMLEK